MSWDRTYPRSVLTALIVGFTPFVAAWGAQNSPPTLEVTLGQLPECVRDQALPERMALRLGFFSMNGNEKSARNSLRCFVRLWPLQVRNPATDKLEYINDPVSREDLSAGLLAVLQLDPDIFFDEMSQHPAVLDDWLAHVGNDAFQWTGPPPCRLDERRKRIVLIVEAAPIVPKTAAIRERTLKAFRSIQCRTFD